MGATEAEIELPKHFVGMSLLKLWRCAHTQDQRETMASQSANKGGGPNLFDLFYDLAAEAEATRNAAASSLLKLVLASQQSFQEAARVAQGTDGPANVSSDVQYTLGRLIKGLGSGRAAARPGFATALVALLREVPEVTTTEVYKAIAETTRTSGSMKGYEERDAYFGRIFGFLCLHRAGRLSVTNVSKHWRVLQTGSQIPQAWASAADHFPRRPKLINTDLLGFTFVFFAQDAEAASVGAMPIGRIVGNIVTELATLAAKKAWLSEVCHEALAAIIPSIPQSLYTKYVNGPISNLMGASAASGPSSAEFRPAQASLVAATSRLYRASPDASAAPDFAATLAKMVSSADFSALRPAALSACHAYPHLHTFWRRVGDAWVVAGAMTDAAWHGVAGRSRADADSDAAICPAQPNPATVASFSAFWKQCVDVPLLAPGASHERKATGLAVLALYLPYAAPEIVDAMLSSNALHVIKVNARKRTNYLHKPARATLQVLAGSVIAAQSPALATAVFTSIMSRGHAQWDQRTRSRVVEYCQRFVDADTLTTYMHSSMAQFVAGATEGDADAEDDAAADGPAGAAAGAAADSDEEGSDDDSDDEDSEWKKLAEGLGEGAVGGSSGPEVQRLWCVDSVSAAAKHLSRNDDGASAAAQAQATVFMVTHALFQPEESHNSAVAAVYKKVSGAKLPASAADGGAVVPVPAIRKATAEMVSRKLYSSVWDTAAAAGVAAASARAATRRTAAGAGEAPAVPAGEGDTAAATATSSTLVQLCASIHTAWAAACEAGVPPAEPLEEGTAAVGEAMQLAQALQQAAHVLSEATPEAVASALGVSGSDSVAVADLHRTALSYAALLAVVAARALSAPAAILPLLADLLAAARALVLLPLHAASVLAPEPVTGKTPKKSKRKSSGGASGVWRGVPISAWASDEVEGGEAKAIVVVTEVLLSLLSNLGASAGAGAASGALPPPGAALVRETVKLASAGLAPLVNAGAVEAVVSVLAASLEDLAPEPAATAADGDDASADGGASDEDDDEGSDEETDEDGNDSGSDDEEDEGESAADASDAEVDDAATAVTEGTLPLPSKEELEAMDRMVSGIVNAKADGAAAAAAAKARRDAALHFQFRASDLLDSWAGRIIGRTQHLLMLMPLLRASRVLGNRVRLSGGSHPCRGIAQRVTALLTKLTAKTSTVPQLLADVEDDDASQDDGDVQLDGAAPAEEGSGSDDGEEDADAASEQGDVLDDEEVGMLGVTLTGAAVAIEECILLASGAAGADFVLAAGRVAAMFLRALMADGVLAEQDELLAPVAAVYSDALTSYLTHKNSKFTSKLFAPLWNVGGSAAVAVVPALLHGMAAGVNGFRSADAVTMLGALLRGAGSLLASEETLPQVAVNTAVVGKRLDTAADAAGSDAEGAPPAAAAPLERLSQESVQDIVDAIAVSLSDLLMRAAQAGRLKLPSQLNAARQKDLIAFARQLVAPKPTGSGASVPAPQGDARDALVQALSALVHCASSGKVQNAAQSALSRLGQGPSKLDLSWFDGMEVPAGSANKPGKGVKRARSGESAVVAKQRASSAFADLASAADDESAEPAAAAAAGKPSKKSKKAKKA